MESPFGGQKKQSAKDMTAEIDRLTDLEANTPQSEGLRSVDGARGGDTSFGMGDDVWAAEGKSEADREALERLNGLTNRGIERDLARGLGREAIFSTPDEEQILESNQEVKRMVAEENGYVQNNLEGGENVIGGESELQVKERLAEDEEDLEADAGKGALPSLKEFHDSLDKQTVQEVRKVIKANEDKPAALASKWFEMMGQFIYENYNRKIGDRN